MKRYLNHRPRLFLKFSFFMYTFRQIFSQALKIAWQNPGLWFFGLFAAMLGSVGELELLLSSYGFGGQGIILAFWQGLATGGLFTSAGLRGIFQVLTTNPVFLFIFILIALIVLAASIFLIWLVNVCVSALISETINVNRGQSFKFSRGFGVGLKKFWPVFGLIIITRLLAWALFGLGGFFVLLNFPGSVYLALTGFVLILIFILSLTFVSKYAICGVVLKDWGFKDGLASAWHLFRQNWLLSLEVAFILFIIYFAVNSLLAFYLPLILFYFLKIFSGFWFGLTLMFILLFFVFLFVQIIFTIFHWASWAIIFLLLSNKKESLTSRLKSGFRGI